MNRERLQSWQIWNMSMGLLGINFGWGLQMANMSAIYEFLGAKPEQIPILWLAAPLTGLLVQPIIGWMSDRTWCWLGRRSPYFLIGAILASLALVLMPLSSHLWMAAGLLWLLDATVNVSMGPFRALVPDILPPSQQSQGYMTQGIVIALGTVLASALPWILQHLFGFSDAAASGQIPSLVKIAFWIGACVFIASIIWTIVTTRELPPADELAPLKIKQSWRANSLSLIHDFLQMPQTMRDLSWVMVFSWMGLFCMFMYFPIAVAHHVFHAEPGTVAYEKGLAWGGLCFAAYGVFFLLTSTLLPWISEYCSQKRIYSISLACGGLALISILLIQTKWQALALMLGVGIAFASMQTIPYAMLAQALPRHKLGIYMGIFNLFIVIPEVLISLGFGPIMEHVLHNQRVLAVATGGVFMLISAVLAQRVRLVQDQAIAHTNLETAIEVL